MSLVRSCPAACDPVMNKVIHLCW